MINTYLLVDELYYHHKTHHRMLCKIELNAFPNLFLAYKSKLNPVRIKLLEKKFL